MEAAFAKFGPLVLHTRIDESLCKKIFKLCNKKNPANHKLVGHIKDQHDIDKIQYINLIKEPLNLYVQTAKKWYDKDFKNEVTINSAWVNYMKAGEYNPPHVHSNCSLSSVLFLEVPKNLAKERAAYAGNGAGPGKLEFLYGEMRYLNNINMTVIPQRGDLCIFPANVTHVVAPFKSKGTRISVAANFTWG